MEQKLHKNAESGNTELNTIVSVDPMLAMIERVAMHPDADIDKMERLLQMRLDMEDRTAERAFNKAIVAAQLEMPKIGKNARNNQTNSDYETLDDLIDQIKPIYGKHGFAPSFGTFIATQDGYDGITCILSHEDGHSREYKSEIPRSGLGIKGNRMMTETHGFGSTSTYGRRYMHKMIWNLSTGEDNDGNQQYALISADQFIELRNLIEKSGTPVTTVLKAYGADTLEQFPLSKLESAMKRLNLTIKEKGAK